MHTESPKAVHKGTWAQRKIASRLSHLANQPVPPHALPGALIISQQVYATATVTTGETINISIGINNNFFTKGGQRYLSTAGVT